MRKAVTSVRRAATTVLLLLAAIESASAQEGPNGYLATNVKVTVDPSRMNWAPSAFGGNLIDTSSQVFQDTLSFWVNIYTDNTIRVESEISTMMFDTSTGDKAMAATTKGISGEVSGKREIKVAEILGKVAGVWNSTIGTETSHSTGWTVHDQLEVELKGDLVVLKVTTTKLGTTKHTYEIPLGFVSLDQGFTVAKAPCAALNGTDWIVGPDGKTPIDNTVSPHHPPASTNPLLDKNGSAWGQRGFVDNNPSGSQCNFVLIGWWIWKTYSGGKLISVTIEPEYEYKATAVSISSVILLKQQPEVGQATE